MKNYNKSISSVIWGLLGLVIFSSAVGAEDEIPPSRLINKGHGHYRFETFSKAQTLDRIYKSMSGPVDKQAVMLLGKENVSATPELFG